MNSVLAYAGAALATASSSTGWQATREQVLSMPTAEIASALLPHDIATTIVSHRFRPNYGPAPLPGGFWTITVELNSVTHRDRGLCVRQTYVVETGPRGIIKTLGSIDEMALASDCTAVPADRFAFASPDGAGPAAANAFVSLVRIQQQARDTADPMALIRVTCTVEIADWPDACAGEARQVLAGLKLNRTREISCYPVSSTLPRCNVDIITERSTATYYTVNVQRDGNITSVDIRWRFVPAF